MFPTINESSGHACIRIVEFIIKKESQQKNNRIKFSTSKYHDHIPILSTPDNQCEPAQSLPYNQ